MKTLSSAEGAGCSCRWGLRGVMPLRSEVSGCCRTLNSAYPCGRGYQSAEGRAGCSVSCRGWVSPHLSMGNSSYSARNHHSSARSQPGHVYTVWSAAPSMSSLPGRHSAGSTAPLSRSRRRRMPWTALIALCPNGDSCGATRLSGAACQWRDAAARSDPKLLYVP